MKLDWKVYLLIAGIVVLGILIVFLHKILMFLMFILLTSAVALFARFVPVMKYIGLELITLSTIFVGITFGPVLGAVYGFVMLLAHLMIGDYYMGVYVVWLIPEYALLGFLSAVFQSEMPIFGVIFISSMNILNLFLTSITENDRLGKHIPYVVGNILLNGAVLILLFDSIMKILG